MPRLPRIHLEGAIYCVTSRGSNKQEIFKDKADYKMYLELLTKYKTQHKFKLFSYCLLPDHLQLLIETGEDATISQIMHDLNSLYTKYFNGRYQKSGHLFESRFKSILVEKARYLVEMTRHIHRASGLDFAQYPFSSFQVYVQGPSQGTLNLQQEANEVMAFLKEKDHSVSYEKYCLEPSKEEIEVLEKNLKHSSVLGSDRFNLQVKNKIQEHSETQKEMTEIKKAKLNPVLIIMVGAAVLVATGSSIYLYLSKAKIQAQYRALLDQREEEFVEKTKFENRSPLALSDLEGTEWEVERFSLSPDKPKEAAKDKIHFSGGHFSSGDFAARGFKTTNYSLIPQTNGVTIWETMQSNAAGDTVTWRGDWQGDAMKGILSYQPKNGAKEDFSFYSVKWTYPNAQSDQGKIK